MSASAKAIATLYRAGRIDLDGVRTAVAKGVLAEDEFESMTGLLYEAGDEVTAEEFVSMLEEVM